MILILTGGINIMDYIVSPRYDECRNWIRKIRAKGVSWNEIKYANKADVNGLRGFINNRIKEDFWPPEITVEMWFEMVESEKRSEEESIKVEEDGLSATIVDESHDNEVNIPVQEKSAWQLYKKQLMHTGMSSLSIRMIENSAYNTLKRLSQDTRSILPIKGLIIGNVQSGKTANMAALMAMAADWGWNTFIILSGTIENLRKQTQQRLVKDLASTPGNLIWNPLDNITTYADDIKCTKNLDFSKNSRTKHLYVCLKNKRRLEILLDWIQYDKNKMNQMKVLVIDDEADQAGINTNKSGKDRTAINRLIVNLVEGKTKKNMVAEGRYSAMNYISYTATPYANFLNEAWSESLYPRNFIKTLASPKEYFGPQEIFGNGFYNDKIENSEGLDIIRIITEYEEKDIKRIHKEESLLMPESFKDAVCWFLCCASAQRLWDYKKPVSMLVHTSHVKDHHKQISDAIVFWLGEKHNYSNIIKRCRNLWDNETMRFTKSDFRSQYPDYGVSDYEIRDYPLFDDIEAGIMEVISEISHIKLVDKSEFAYHRGIHLCIDNSDSKITDEDSYVRLAYPDKDSPGAPDYSTAFIVVGGNTLSRGLTLEGLVSTYFLRSSKQADSLMQMGRWFGYRKGYEMLPRIWMTENSISQFEFLSDLDWELREDLKRFELAGASPTEYGPRILNTPKVSWLRVTAKNKMKSAIRADMDFSGTMHQTTLFDNNADILEKNNNITDLFLESLGKPEKTWAGNSYVWRMVEFDKIYESHLSKFKFHDKNKVFNEIDLFYEWIKHLNKDGKMLKWNVVAAGKQTDKLSDNDSIWKIGEIEIGKVVRTRKVRSTDINSELIDIGVLLAPKDVLADIDISRLDDNMEFRIKKETKARVYSQSYREAAGMEDIPTIIFYRIDKDSSARKTDSEIQTRLDLNAAADLTGVVISVPGKKSAGREYIRTITVKIPEEYNKNDEELEDF